jgi:hypothetical protein
LDALVVVAAVFAVAVLAVAGELAWVLLWADALVDGATTLEAAAGALVDVCGVSVDLGPCARKGTMA